MCEIRLFCDDVELNVEGVCDVADAIEAAQNACERSANAVSVRIDGTTIGSWTVDGWTPATLYRIMSGGMEIYRGDPAKFRGAHARNADEARACALREGQCKDVVVDMVSAQDTIEEMLQNYRCELRVVSYWAIGRGWYADLFYAESYCYDEDGDEMPCDGIAFADWEDKAA